MACFPARLWAPIPLLPLSIDRLHRYIYVTLLYDYSAYLLHEAGPFHWSIMKVCNVLDFTHTNLLRWSADSCTGSTYTLKRHEPYPRHICLRDYERQPRSLSLNIDHLSICIHITPLYVHAAHLWLKMLVTRASIMNVHTNVFLNTLIHRNISPSYWNMLKCWCAHGLFITGKSIAYF